MQRQRRGWKGFITPGPNCTTTGLAITLKPLARRVRRRARDDDVDAVGVGRRPLARRVALDILDNVIPYIAKEEEKVEKETKKILGALDGDGIAAAPIVVSCTCTRVNVLEGHTESVFVALEKKARLDEVKAALARVRRRVRRR